MGERRRRSRSEEQPRELEPSEGRVPPHELQAEAAVLSAVLVDETALDRVSASLRPPMFYAEAHRRIFEAALALSAEGKPVDVVQVATWLRDHDRIAQVGGMAYLTEVLNAAPAVANVEAYAATVRDKWRARQTILAAQRIVAEGYAGVPDVAAYVERSELALYELARQTAGTSRGVNMRDLVARTFAQMSRAYEAGPGELLGVPHGFADLDAQTGGMHPGEQTILAGRPGMGKSALMMNVAHHVAGLGLGVIVFSLEMPSDQLTMRAICGEGRVSIQRARTNRLTTADWSAMTESSMALTQPRHWYVEDRSLGMAELRSIVRTRHAEMAREGVKLALVAIDYAQIIEPPADSDPRDRAERALAENARAGKRLAKETGAHVMLLSQLNRQVEARANKRPLLSDLRESGALEEAADCAIGIFREDYYQADSKAKGRAELIILKQRNGPTCTVDLAFDGPTARFTDLPRGPVDGHAATCHCADCSRGEAAE